MMGLRQIPHSELVRRAIERTGHNSWLALVVADGQIADVVEQIAHGIASESAANVVRLDAPKDAKALARAGRRGGILVASIVDTWPAGEWARLDALRSRLEREHCAVLVLSEAAARHIFSEAPHFARFFTGSVWELTPGADELREADRRERIASFERWAQMSTEEMIARAEKKTLPSDPEYAEWLVLAQRSDLL